MKVAFCLLAVLAVALARPQNGEQFWPEALQRARQQQIIRPDERLENLQVAPLVNQLENVPANQRVAVEQIVVPLNDGHVYPHLQRSVDEAFARY